MHSAFRPRIKRSAVCLLSSLSVCGLGFCQTNSPFNPSAVNTPPPLLGGAPSGSYSLSDLDTVNVYNGHLNFALPLHHVEGRGDAQFTMMLPIERTWNAVYESSLNAVRLYDIFWYAPPPAYSPGLLIQREVGDGVINCVAPPGQNKVFNCGRSRLIWVAKSTPFIPVIWKSDNRRSIGLSEKCRGFTEVFGVSRAYRNTSQVEFWQPENAWSAPNWLF